MPTRKQEDGWILITSIVLMTLMLLIALASMSIVDTQQKRTGDQRQRESSLNLAEGVLYAQGFQLARHWPGTLATSVPNDCSSATAGTYCPVAAQVQQNSDNIDTRTATTWTSAVRDNGGNLAAAFQSTYMNAAQSGTNAAGQAYTCAAPCRWDANGDRKLWVVSTSIVRGKQRSVVATLKLEKLAESTPRAAVTAGGINTVNNGNQVKIYAVGSNVVVRCNPSQSQCVTDQGGISPAAVQGTPPNMMTPLQLERFKQRAISDGTYYNGCSAIKTNGSGDFDLAGAVVFVDNCDARGASAKGSLAMSTCVDTLPPKPAGGGNGLAAPCINTKAVPGLLIWHCGGLQLTGNGNGTFIGIMYFVNNSDGTCTSPTGTIGSNPPDCSGNKNSVNNVFTSSGGFGVWGAVSIDGNGCLYAGSNGMQVQYDYNVFNSVASYGTVGLVQDTWRELTPS